jgi:four helix bundle protein
MEKGDKKSLAGFEDLEVWQISMDIAVETYKLTNSFPKSEIYSLVSQMRRASSSISANIAEGYGRYNVREKAQFYKIANGSLLELKSFYYLSKRLEFTNTSDTDSIVARIASVQRMLSALIKSLKDRE